MIGWNLYQGPLRGNRAEGGTPDFRWFNAQPELLLERRGGITETLIDRIESAVDAYPYAYRYRVWPGPNSNSFTAFVARKVPELGLDLPLRRLERIFLQKVS